MLQALIIISIITMVMNPKQALSCRLSLIMVLIATLVCISQQSYPNKPTYRIRQIIDYQQAFNKQSNVTLIFYSCGGLLDLKQSIYSFFFYNTYPLKQMILIDRCQTLQIDLRNTLPLKNQQNQQYFRVLSFKGSQIQELQMAFSYVLTPYVMLMPNKWITYDGRGFIEQSIDAIQYGFRNNIRISQVTSLFPNWKNYRALSKYTKTRSGTVFYQIRSFKPVNRYYFTLNPSFLNFEYIYNQILKKDFMKYCSSKQCPDGTQLRDCCQKQLGKQLYEVNNYIQVFIDDGSIEANVFSVE